MPELPNATVCSSQLASKVSEQADSRKPPQANETEILQRIWDEVPGGFLDLREGELREQGDEFPEPEEEEKHEEGEKGGLMSAEDMEALRTTVCSNLK